MGVSFVKELSPGRGFKAGLLEGPETPAAPSGFAVYLLCMRELFFVYLLRLWYYMSNILLLLHFIIFLYSNRDFYFFLYRCFQLSLFVVFLIFFCWGMTGRDEFYLHTFPYTGTHTHKHNCMRAHICTQTRVHVLVDLYKYIRINIYIYQNVAAAFSILHKLSEINIFPLLFHQDPWPGLASTGTLI